MDPLNQIFTSFDKRLKIVVLPIIMLSPFWVMSFHIFKPSLFQNGSTSIAVVYAYCFTLTQFTLVLISFTLLFKSAFIKRAMKEELLIVSYLALPFLFCLLSLLGLLYYGYAINQSFTEFYTSVFGWAIGLFSIGFTNWVFSHLKQCVPPSQKD